MKKTIVTLRSAPSESIEVPKTVKDGTKDRALERSCFGALRLFPGVPKTITTDELEFIKEKQSEVFLRLEVRPYVESKRVDVRGASEADIEKMAAEEGLGHLRLRDQVDRLQKRGKLKRPEKRETAARGAGKKTAPAANGRATRKPRTNGDDK
jgi:hypothetical protein